MKAFRAPQTTLGDLDAARAAALIASATDVAVILDADGIIRDVSINADDLMHELRGGGAWIGKNWIDTVTEESRPKARELIDRAFSGQESRWRHLNHPTPAGPDLPVLYAAVQASAPGRIIAFGRGLRAVSTLQRRLVDAQQSMERDYTRMRQIEMRYRMLFEMSSDAVLVLAQNGRGILEANPAARRLLGQPDVLDGTRLMLAFTDDTAAAVEFLISGVLASGRADDVRARLRDGDMEVTVSASMLLADDGGMCLLRVGGTGMVEPTGTAAKLKVKLLKLMESAPDAFAVTSADGRVLTANSAFLHLTQLPNEERARGEALDRWLGRGGTDQDILLANLRQHGSIRLYSTMLRGELNLESDVEISAVAVMNGGGPCYGFLIRDVSRRVPAGGGRDWKLPGAFSHLNELIGKVALKELVRDATNVIERMCIEAALELTGDNRASAAELLGLSRQSLYIKLHRHGLGDLSSEGTD